jgi:hypothetical protein
LFSRRTGQGHATEVLRQITAFADQEGLTLCLIAWPYGPLRKGGLTAKQLVSFYERFGFEGGTYDVGIGTFMVRQPTVKMVVENP